MYVTCIHVYNAMARLLVRYGNMLQVRLGWVAIRILCTAELLSMFVCACYFLMYRAPFYFCVLLHGYHCAVDRYALLQCAPVSCNVRCHCFITICYLCHLVLSLLFLHNTQSYFFYQK